MRCLLSSPPGEARVDRVFHSHKLPTPPRAPSLSRAVPPPGDSSSSASGSPTHSQDLTGDVSGDVPQGHQSSAARAMPVANGGNTITARFATGRSASSTDEDHALPIALWPYYADLHSSAATAAATASRRQNGFALSFSASSGARLPNARQENRGRRVPTTPDHTACQGRGMAHAGGNAWNSAPMNTSHPPLPRGVLIDGGPRGHKITVFPNSESSHATPPAVPFTSPDDGRHRFRSGPSAKKATPTSPS